jgi:hypothetical protein
MNMGRPQASTLYTQAFGKLQLEQGFIAITRIGYEHEYSAVWTLSATMLETAAVRRRRGLSLRWMGNRTPSRILAYPLQQHEF